jgi:hypothetical protein
LLEEWFESANDVQMPILSDDQWEDIQKTFDEVIVLQSRVEVYSSSRIQLLQDFIIR